jgi:ribonucleotide monophosphatase NagD (HAD superfamily)
VGRLSGIETVLLDLDGTLYVGSQVVPGAPEAVRWLRDQGLTVRFCTNTDSIAPAALADRLARLGFQTSADELVTPVAVAERLFGAAPEARVLGKPSPEFFTAPLDALAADRAPRWSSATTWPPTLAAGRRSGRPQCWYAAARGPPPAGRRGRA